jgi:hypothetical protein
MLSITNGTVFTRNLELTTAQLDALFVTPIQIVAAPGPGRIVVPVACHTIVVRVAAGWAPWSAGGNLIPVYAGETSTIMAANFSHLLNSAAAGYTQGWTTIGSPTTSVLDRVNKAIHMRLSAESNPGGSAKAYVTLMYFVTSNLSLTA